MPLGSLFAVTVFLAIYLSGLEIKIVVFVVIVARYGLLLTGEGHHDYGLNDRRKLNDGRSGRYREGICSRDRSVIDVRYAVIHRRRLNCFLLFLVLS